MSLWTPYTLEDGYAVFNFIVKICGPVDVDGLKNDLACTVQQLHRARRLLNLDNIRYARRKRGETFPDDEL